MDANDWAAIAADFAAIRGDAPVSITIRRGTTVLPPQTVRLTGGGRAMGTRDRSEASASSVDRALIVGPIDLDVQPDDEFTHGGSVYVVTAPIDRRAGQTTVEAEVRQ